MIYNSMCKKKYGLEEKETIFQYKYCIPLDFSSHSLMSLIVESCVIWKESKRVKVGT
jgi:hypothetical protein